MRSERLSAARRGSMLALAAGLAALPLASLAGQAATARVLHPGAILVQTMDTSINPLAAEIVLPAFGLGVRLSDEGIALLMNIPDGTYLIQARHLGYSPEWRFVRIARDTARIEFILAPADTEAAGREGLGLADSRLRDFLRRTAMIQHASFITRAEINRRNPRNLAALLSRIPEIKIDRAGRGRTLVRSERAERRGCGSGMLVFVDGMLPSFAPVAVALAEAPAERRLARALRPERGMRGATSARLGDVSHLSAAASAAREPEGAEALHHGGPTGSSRPSSPLDWVPMSLVAAVEIYPMPADVPPEFQVAGAECGVVLVWTVRR
jgi:hypothetical protein